MNLYTFYDAPQGILPTADTRLFAQRVKQETQRADCYRGPAVVWFGDLIFAVEF